MLTTKHVLSQAANHTPSPDNSQPWRLEWRDNILSVYYDTQRVVNKTFPPDSHATLLTIGAVSENLTQAADALNIDINLSYTNPLDSHSPLYFRADFDFTNTQALPSIDNIALFQRHTNRHAYQDKPLPPEQLQLLKNLTEGKNRILVFEDKPNIRTIAELVRRASEIRFQTREVHEWLARSLRFDTKTTDPYGEGLDVNTIDLPPGGKLFLRLISDWNRMNWLNKLGAHKAMAFIDSHPIAKAPAILAIVGPDDYQATLHAGQLMNRAWISLNASDIAAHPYYVAADQLQRRKENRVPSNLKTEADQVFQQARQLFQLQENETLHMLFRIGAPTRAAVKSKRLPLDIVCPGIE